MKTTALQVIEKAITNSSMTVTNIVDPVTDNHVRLYARDGAGLTVYVELVLHNNDWALIIEDVCNEDNFAIMYPTKGNMRSLARCMRMCMDNIIKNADA